MATIEVRTPERILNRALELFASKGYDATSVREICAAAAITKPTLYHFYGSKERVYRALVEGALEDFRNRVVSLLGSPGSPRERLNRVARDYFGHAREHQQLVRFLFSLIHNPPSSAPRTDFPRFYEDIVRLISRVVAEGVGEGCFGPGPTDLRMLVFMGTLAEAVIGYLIVGKPELTPELADLLVDVVLQGWVPREEVPAP
jgi:TetR/AcrR family transcriptional regulator